MAEERRAGLVVYVVDDDASIRDSLALMLGLTGYATQLYGDAESLLAAFRDDWSGCVVADLRLPGMTGVELQERLRARGSDIPFVIITAHGDVPAARAAFRARAVDFIEKPFDDAQLRAAIDAAFASEQRRVEDATHSLKLARLTPREKEVLEHVGRGLHSKEIGRALGISARTVEVHRTHLMEKLEARNTAELVRFALLAQR